MVGAGFDLAFAVVHFADLRRDSLPVPSVAALPGFATIGADCVANCEKPLASL
jgi:hypothetical protein